MPGLLKNKRGFYVSAPMVGVVLFLIAASISGLIIIENDHRIDVSRSSDVRGTIRFISEAILADSYDVLLQQNLEQETYEFLREDYFDIDTGEDWKQNMRSNLVDHYLEELGGSLRINMETYAEAYGNMPTISYCRVESADEGSLSLPSVEDSEDDDGTIKARGYSYGESIVCESRDPEAQVKVDVSGRYYRINLRLPDLYDVAKIVVNTAKGALNEGGDGLPVPLAVWEASKWFIVRKTDNTLLNREDKSLDNLVDKWGEIMAWFSERIKSISNNKIRDAGYSGVRLKDFESVQEKEGDYGLEDFELSCVADGVGKNRNCMPFRTIIRLGEKDCGPLELPEGSENPFYNVKNFDVKCGVGNCKDSFRRILLEIMRPLGNVCIDYYGSTDSVYPVCKKWQAKAKSAVHKGVLSDDKREYVVVGDETEFRFKDQQPNVDVDDIIEDRLTCEDGEDSERYKDNVRKILENMELKMGVSQTEKNGVQILRWADKGSFISGLKSEELVGVYQNIYGKGTVPRPCFLIGVRPSNECLNEELRKNPMVEISVVWEGIRASCINRVNDLCGSLCGGDAIPTYTETFCKGLFPETATSGAVGNLRCDCGNSKVQINGIGMSHGGSSVSGFEGDPADGDSPCLFCRGLG